MVEQIPDNVKPEKIPDRPVYHAGPELIKGFMTGLAIANRSMDRMLAEEERDAGLAARPQEDRKLPASA